METDTTTPDIVGPGMLGVVASVLTVVCKRMQQLPAMLGPAGYSGKDTTQKTLYTMCYASAWPQQCWNEACGQPNTIFFQSLVTSPNLTLLSLLSKYDLRRFRELCPKP